MNRTKVTACSSGKKFFFITASLGSLFSIKVLRRERKVGAFGVCCVKKARAHSGTFLFGEKITARARNLNIVSSAPTSLCGVLFHVDRKYIWVGTDGFWFLQKPLFFYHFFLCSSIDTPPGPRDTTISSPPITDNVWKKSYLRKSLMGLYEGMVHHALK